MWALLTGMVMAVQAPPAALPDFAEASARARPAVVKVQATLAPAHGAPAGPGDEEFFAVPEHHGFTGGGSGFIVSSDGVVLTNHHVVERAGAIRVQLADRRSFSARLIGSDPPSDIAVLKIPARHLPVLEYGDSEQLLPGAWVLAIGSPFDMDFSVTAGIVSAKGRSLGPEQRFVSFLQTDVAINRGNSGGPLLDLQGRVVGMNSAIFSQTGGFVGLSFAIPAATVRAVTAQIRSDGRVRRGFLGVGYQDLTPPLGRAVGLETVSGAMINQLQEGSPADRAGLQLGDVVLAVDSVGIAAAAELPALIGARLPGTPVVLRVQRAGEPLDVRVMLSELNIPAAPARPVSRTLQPLALTDADAAERDLLRIDHAVVVRQASHQALAMGLRRGDAITAILGRDQLPDAVALQALLEQALAADSAPLALEVRRGAQRLFIGWSGEDAAATLH